MCSHGGDSNVYIEFTIFKIIKENHPKLFLICGYGIFPRDSRMSSKQPW